MPLPILDEVDSNVVRLTNQVLNEELLTPNSLTMEPTFTDIDGMRRFAVAASTAMDIRRSVEETREALRQAGDALTKAHEAAAVIRVAKLEVDDIKDFTAKLKELNKEIQKDRDFHRALELSKALVTTLGDLA